MKKRTFAVACASVGVMLAPAAPARAAPVTPTGGVQFRLAHSGKCVNIAWRSIENNAAVIQYTCGSETDSNDKFALVPRGNGNYWIRNLGSNKCLNVNNNATANNAPIIQYTCNSQLNGLWKVEEVLEQPTVRFRAASTGKCLNLPNGKLDNSVQLIQYTCSPTAASANEKFFLPPTASPAAVNRPFTRRQPVSVVQGVAPAAGGVAPVQYSYLRDDNHLQIITDRNPDPANTDPNAPGPVLVETYNFGYTGRTSAARLADGRVQTVVHDASSGDVVLADERYRGTGEYGDIWDIGGAFDAQPVVAPMGPNGALATWAIVNGRLWYAPQQVNNPQTPYGAWRNLGGPALTGTPAVVRDQTGSRIFALDTTGRLWSATFNGVFLTDWADLGGSGLTGTPSAVARPGFAMSVFVRGADGTIRTKRQDAGKVWSDWSPITGLDVAGSPSTLIDWAPGRIAVAARGADGLIHVTFETQQDSGAYTPWYQVSDPETDPETVAASDPTTFGYTVPSTGASLGIAFRSTVIDEPVVYVLGATAPNARAAAPSFERRELGKADEKIRMK